MITPNSGPANANKFRAATASRPRICSGSWASAPTRRRGRGCTSCARPSSVRPNREPLGENVQIDEAFVGAKRAGKSLVLVATETDGRVRMTQAENKDAETCKRFANAEIAPQASVTTDGHKGYSKKSLGARPHTPVAQSKAERAQADALQTAHWTISLLKRWLLGTHVSMGVELSANVGDQISLGGGGGVGSGISRFRDRRFSFLVGDRAAWAGVAG
jgi:ISXO2-like transposase domain